MRIISGSLKGKSINFLKNSTTRPLKDSVKENVFNILSHSNLININLDSANVLDLYSGVGSFGIECLSRGVEKVTFIEEDNKAAKILEKNLNFFSFNKKSKIINEKIENYFRKKKNEKYNIIFFDPPYVDKTFIQNLILIKKNKIYDNKHVIILHRDKKTNDGLEKYLDVVITRVYGRSKLFFGKFN